MSWRRILATYAVALSIAGYLYVQSGDREAPNESITTAVSPLLRTDVSTIDSIAIEGGKVRVLVERHEKRWRVAEPVGAKITSDLIDALLETLSRIPPIEVVSEDDSADEEFGLSDPSIVMTMDAGADPVAAIQIGDRSPTRTAVYARTDGDPAVYLLGLNAHYYAQLILQEIEAKAANGG